MPPTDEWDLAPCGLLEVDGNRVVIRANQRFLARTGYTQADIAEGLLWTSLLTPAGRIFYETQLAPMLALNGSVEELLIDIVGPGGRRLPVLLTAEQEPGGGSGRDGGRIRVALMAVPDRQQYERQLREARRQAEDVSEASLHVRRRLELLAGANSALASSLDARAALGRLARLLVEELADWCIVYTVDPHQPHRLPEWAAAHAQSDRQPALDRLAQLLPLHASEESVLRRVVAGGEPVVLSELDTEDVRRLTTSDEVVDLVTEVGVRSVLVVPSTARAQQAAVLLLARNGQRPRFTGDDLTEVVELAERTGIAIDNLRMYAREHSTSIALQKALLTPLPAHPTLQLASRYAPGANGSEVGGDWYDAFRQPDGTTVVVVGDVVGHDIEAAAAMGHLRGVIRTIGHTTSGSPAETLADADRAAAGLQVRVVASAVVASLREISRDVFAVHWSCAGHPPPLLVRAEGDVTVLSRRSDLLLGVLPDRERQQFALQMRSGDTLVLYTDGLVERRDEDLDESIERLAAGLAGTAQMSLDQLCEHALKVRPPGNNDDVALLAVRVGSAAPG